MGIAVPWVMAFEVLIFMIVLAIIYPILNNYVINPLVQGSINFEMDRLWKIMVSAGKGEIKAIPDKFYLYKNQIFMQIYGDDSCTAELSKAPKDYSQACDNNYCICVVSWDSGGDIYFDPGKINAPSWMYKSGGSCATMKASDSQEVVEKGNGDVDSCKAITTKEKCMNAREKYDDSLYKPCVWDVVTGSYYQVLASDIYFTYALGEEQSIGSDNCINVLSPLIEAKKLKGLHCRSLGSYDNPLTDDVEDIPIFMQKPTLDVDPALSSPSMFLWALSAVEFNVDGGVVATQSKIAPNIVDVYFRFGG